MNSLSRRVIFHGKLSILHKFAAVQLPSPIHFETTSNGYRVSPAKVIMTLPEARRRFCRITSLCRRPWMPSTDQFSIVLSPMCFIPIENNCYIIYICILVICVVFLNIFRCASQFCQISPMLMPILACECSFSYHVWKGKTASHFQTCRPRFW